MTAKLTLYNDAMLHLGQERLASLTEASVSRYALDDAYDLTLRYCLEQHPWKFATRVVEIDSNTSITPSFGYTYAFDKPDDFRRTLQAAGNTTFTPQFIGREFADEPNYWYADVDPIYVSFISDHVNYGKDLSLWPETFADYVARRLANRTSKRITGNPPNDNAVKMEILSLREARSKDALAEPVKFPPMGSWAASRSRGSHARSRWDRQS